MGTKLTLDAIVGEPGCSGRRRFSKRQRPKSERIDWCPWCATLLKGTDSCAAHRAIQALREASHDH